jgi:tetratricopeptide (TPR) repeat protein
MNDNVLLQYLFLGAIAFFCIWRLTTQFSSNTKEEDINITKKDYRARLVIYKQYRYRSIKNKPYSSRLITMITANNMPLGCIVLFIIVTVFVFIFAGLNTAAIILKAILLFILLASLTEYIYPIIRFIKAYDKYPFVKAFTEAEYEINCNRNYDEGIRLLKKAIAIYPTANAYFALAELFKKIAQNQIPPHEYYKRDYTEALFYYDKAFELNPQGTGILRERINIKQEIGLHESALQDCYLFKELEFNSDNNNDLSKSSHDLAWTLHYQARDQIIIGNYDDALENLNTATITYDYSLRYYLKLRAYANYQLKNFNESTKDYFNATIASWKREYQEIFDYKKSKFGIIPESKSQIFKVLRSLQGYERPFMAMKSPEGLQDFLTRLYKELGYEKTWMMRLPLINHLYNIGQEEKALSLYNQAVEKGMNSIPFYDDYESGKAEVEKEIQKKKRGRRKTDFNFLAADFAIRKGYPGLAIKYLNNLAQISGFKSWEEEGFPYKILRARIRLKRWEFTLAEEDLNHVLENPGGNYEAYIWMGYLKHDIGDFEAALDNYEIYISCERKHNENWEIPIYLKEKIASVKEELMDYEGAVEYTTDRYGEWHDVNESPLERRKRKLYVQKRMLGNMDSEEL